MTAVILAAGFSKRFGKEKLLTELHGKPVFLHVIDRVLEMGFAETVLVYRSEEVKKALHHGNVKCVHNPDASEGISSSVKLGVGVSSPADAYTFFMGDQPFIDAGTVSILRKAFYNGGGSIVVPRYGGRNGNPVIFSSAWKPQLEALTGDTGGRTIISANPDKVCFVEIQDKRAGMDIDTFEDFCMLNNVSSPPPHRWRVSD